MEQEIHTFSVKSADKKNSDLIKKLRADCKAQGRSFSFIVLEALKEKYDRK